MNLKAILAVLLLFGISFAWNSAPPVGETIYTVLGVNFTYNIAATPLGELASCKYGAGFLNNDAAKVYGCTVESKGTDKTYIPMPQTNSTITVSGYAANPAYYSTIGIGSDAVIIYTTANGSIKSYNSTHMNLTNGTSDVLLPLSASYLEVTGSAAAIKSNFTEYNTSSNINESSGTSFAHDFYLDSYISYFQPQNKVIRSDFTNAKGMRLTDGNTSTYCKATLYYGSTLLIPKITYIPSENAFGDFYNASNNAAYLPNNTLVYVLDANSGQWYGTIMPYTCVSYTNVTSVSMSLYPYSSVVSTPPTMYLIQNCYGDALNANFTWDIKGTSSKTFNFTKYWSGGTDSQTFTGIRYTSSTNLTGAYNLTISDGTYTICAWSNSTSVLFAQIPFISNYNLTNTAGKFMIVTMAGISVAVPFAALGLAFMNDLVGAFSNTDMFIIAAAAFGCSFVVNAFHEKSLKAIPFYAILGISIVGSFLSLSVGKTTLDTNCIPDFLTMNSEGRWIPVAGLQTAIDSFSQLLTSGQIVSFFAIGAVVNLFVQFIIFIVTLPLYIPNAIFAPIKCINMNLYNALFQFSSLIIFAIPAYIYLKSYEVASNKYRNI